MAVTKEIERYKCDKCPLEKYFEAGDKAKADWQTVSRYDVNKVGKQYLYCPECYEKWKTHQAAADADFNAFMKG